MSGREKQRGEEWPTLSLRGVYAHWYAGQNVIGYSHRRAIFLKGKLGEWIGVVGSNGIGKSTLLHAIAGTVHFVTGEIAVNGHSLPARDPGARFLTGVQHVTQEPSMPMKRFVKQDALDLAISRRAGLDNERAIENLFQILDMWGVTSTTHIGPRQFDLVTSILTAPSVLLLDEVAPLFPSDAQTSEIYKRLRSVLPWTTVVFVDHNIERVVEAGDTVVWLREGQQPLVGRPENEEFRNVLIAEFRKEAGDLEEMQKDEVFFHRTIKLQQSPRAQIDLAVKSTTGDRRTSEKLTREIYGEFPFLNISNPAENLSGGQRIILFWLMCRLGHLGSCPQRYLDHLDRNLAGKLTAWEDKWGQNDKLA